MFSKFQHTKTKKVIDMNSSIPRDLAEELRAYLEDAPYNGTAGLLAAIDRDDIGAVYSTWYKYRNLVVDVGPKWKNVGKALEKPDGAERLLAVARAAVRFEEYCQKINDAYRASIRPPRYPSNYAGGGVE